MGGCVLWPPCKCTDPDTEYKESLGLKLTGESTRVYPTPSRAEVEEREKKESWRFKSMSPKVLPRDSWRDIRGWVERGC